MQADSDLGPRPVTVAVGPMTRADIATAIARGAAVAESFRARGLIEACAITETRMYIKEIFSFGGFDSCGNM